jgi:hypothetical protein
MLWQVRLCKFRLPQIKSGYVKLTGYFTFGQVRSFYVRLIQVLPG